LDKGPKPEVLEQHAKAWTFELLEKIKADEDPGKYLLGRYSHPDIKAALLLETKGKCAYCESPLRHIAYGDIEHIIPKSIEPSLRFDWDNLTIACDICNTKKSDAVGLIDPYRGDPEEAFEFVGPLIWAKPSNGQAVLTEEQLDLNRQGLVERRVERMEFLRNLVSSAASKNEDIKRAMLRRASNEVLNDKPFSACAKTAYRKLLAHFGLVG
jgi:uncharacterized protein (TIGR02646 family)